ncbi:hypothetical protein GXW83_32335 [Streptacidiphilus sp. PB12-B1b]|uniref:hypothetical protein n=1 Tax=Streptacidiphilus sp. PB12-B1b TaxID=2705012 RepID=UPI0015FB9EFB|nr:hypothetical protein [Streptacidiphilus sp. PB12-B1b]QMU79698.1 hypothetical protein GXW83_32335 [Streptacidiphilus sp. PB12-B1b]
MTTRPVRLCDYCDKPAGTPVVRHRPGDRSSKLVGVSHDDCYGRFLAEAVLVRVAWEMT